MLAVIWHPEPKVLVAWAILKWCMSNTEFIVARAEPNTYIVEATDLSLEEAGEKVIELDSANPQKDYHMLERHK
jgi:hypothetical protein